MICLFGNCNCCLSWKFENNNNNLDNYLLKWRYIWVDIFSEVNIYYFD